MNSVKAAVIVFEEDASIPMGSKSLMLETIAERPVLWWTAERLLSDGVQRFFAVVSPRFEADVRACFPKDAALMVSERHAALMEFLSRPEKVLVLPRAALPMAEAGAGFAYTASGPALRQVWQERMTNAVTEAVPEAGWLPIFGPETIAELEPVLRARQSGQ